LSCRLQTAKREMKNRGEQGSKRSEEEKRSALKFKICVAKGFRHFLRPKLLTQAEMTG